MGGICSRPSAVEDSRDSPRERLSSNHHHHIDKGSLELRGSRASSIRKEERTKEKVDARVTLIDKSFNGSSRRLQDDHKLSRVKVEPGGATSPGISKIPKGLEGEQIAAGWPAWLVADASQAIKGWIPRRADTYEKLDKIGQGTYSNVYKARDTVDGKIVAIKRVRFDNLDPESVKFMAREILILRRLDHPNIIKLKGLITSKMSCNLYLVFEYMEHDLTGLASLPDIKFTEPQIKCYMKQLLSGLEHCHKHGVLHRDIKGSNLLIDNSGTLKIADFGLATFYDPRHNYPLTSRVVTLWYRPPELLLGSTHYGAAVDLWSTGCILGELYTGRPIMPGKTEVEQLHKIYKLCGSPSEDFWRKQNLHHAKVFKPQQPYKRRVTEMFKDYPVAAVALLETLLSMDPASRGTAAAALKSEFFKAEPRACDPSSLPQYPPSKEIDAKMREEESKRHRAEEGRSQSTNPEKRKPTESLVHPGPNGESTISMQNQGDGNNSKSRTVKFNPWKDEVVSGFPVDPSGLMSQESHQKRAFYSGPLVQGSGRMRSGKKLNDPSMISTRAGLSTLSGLVAARTSTSDEKREKTDRSQPTTTHGIERFSGPLNDYDSAIKRDQKRYSHRFPNVWEDAKTYSRDREPMMKGRGSEGNKIAFSGPLVPSTNVDRILKEHDRRIQEINRSQLGKARQVESHDLSKYN